MNNSLSGHYMVLFHLVVSAYYKHAKDPTPTSIGQLLASTMAAAADIMLEPLLDKELRILGAGALMVRGILVDTTMNFSQAAHPNACSEDAEKFGRYLITPEGTSEMEWLNVMSSFCLLLKLCVMVKTHRKSPAIGDALLIYLADEAERNYRDGHKFTVVKVARALVKPPTRGIINRGNNAAKMVLLHVPNERHLPT